MTPGNPVEAALLIQEQLKSINSQMSAIEREKQLNEYRLMATAASSGVGDSEMALTLDKQEAQENLLWASYPNVVKTNQSDCWESKSKSDGVITAVKVTLYFFKSMSLP